MKTVLSLALALILALSVIPAVAGDTFQALSKVSTDKKVLLTPLADNELAAIEGGYYFESCYWCSNTAVVTQVNIATYSYDTNQSNFAKVYQSNN